MKGVKPGLEFEYKILKAIDRGGLFLNDVKLEKYDSFIEQDLENIYYRGPVNEKFKIGISTVSQDDRVSLTTQKSHVYNYHQTCDLEIISFGLGEPRDTNITIGIGKMKILTLQDMGYQFDPNNILVFDLESSDQNLEFLKWSKRKRKFLRASTFTSRNLHNSEIAVKHIGKARVGILKYKEKTQSITNQLMVSTEKPEIKVEQARAIEVTRNGVIGFNSKYLKLLPNFYVNKRSLIFTAVSKPSEFESITGLKIASFSFQDVVDNRIKLRPGDKRKISLKIAYSGEIDVEGLELNIDVLESWQEIAPKFEKVEDVTLSPGSKSSFSVKVSHESIPESKIAILCSSPDTNIFISCPKEKLSNSENLEIAASNKNITDVTEEYINLIASIKDGQHSATESVKFNIIPRHIPMKSYELTLKEGQSLPFDKIEIAPKYFNWHQNKSDIFSIEIEAFPELGSLTSHNAKYTLGDFQKIVYTPKESEIGKHKVKDAIRFKISQSSPAKTTDVEIQITILPVDDKPVVIYGQNFEIQAWLNETTNLYPFLQLSDQDSLYENIILRIFGQDKKKLESNGVQFLTNGRVVDQFSFQDLTESRVSVKHVTTSESRARISVQFTLIVGNRYGNEIVKSSLKRVKTNLVLKNNEIFRSRNGDRDFNPYSKAVVKFLKKVLNTSFNKKKFDHSAKFSEESTTALFV